MKKPSEKRFYFQKRPRYDFMFLSTGSVVNREAQLSPVLINNAQAV